MNDDSLGSVIGSVLTSLPWCCIAPAAFAVSGLASAGIGTALQSAMPIFLVLSVGLLSRSLSMVVVKRQGARWARATVLASTPVIAMVWAFRFGWLPL